MSEHFKRSEFCCPHCGGNDIDPEFVELLDKIRGQYGKPMVITSGYRCPIHNAAAGGVDGSAHTEGLAADISCSFAGDRMKLVTLALANGIKRIGCARTFLHLDVSATLPSDVFWLY